MQSIATGGCNRLHDTMNLLLWPVFFPLAPQQTGRLHLRRRGAELHGRQGRGLQAGHHRQRQGVRLHRLRHRHPEGLGLEARSGPGHPHAVRRWWELQLNDFMWMKTLREIPEQGRNLSGGCQQPLGLALSPSQYSVSCSHSGLAALSLLLLSYKSSFFFFC